MTNAEIEAGGAGRPSLASAVGRIAAALGSEDFPPGLRAGLRRLSPGRPPGLAFYRFAEAHLPLEWERVQDRWVTIVCGMALMSPGPHRPDQPAGKTLAESGYSEKRLERLLAADEEALQTLLLRAARFLAAKGAPCNWTDFAALLLAQGDQPREKARLRIARDFYKAMAPEKKEKKER